MKLFAEAKNNLHCSSYHFILGFEENNDIRMLWGYMSQLIKLKQRMQTIETIQKVTQAMRLVSMSMHMRLTNQLPYQKTYEEQLHKILAIIGAHTRPESDPAPEKTLLIAIASQKGLCSSFNTVVAQATQNFLQKNTSETIETVIIGKKLIDVLEKKITCDYTFPTFKRTDLNSIVQQLFAIIGKEKHNYNRVLCISNYPKTFFVQELRTTELLPTIPSSSTAIDSDDYVWDQSAEELFPIIEQKQLTFQLYTTLFASLVAEYAARFRAMDSATRNAEGLLETTQRQYNKQRQAKITRELVELSGIFQAQ